MTTLAIVVTLVGQAWAENANGERRALEVGDQLAVDETLVMAEGARIDLDFGDNQQLTFLGEQQVTPEDRGDLIEQAEGLAPLENREQPESGTSAEPSQSASSEGRSFVQLVRIGEIIEADGFTPVTVARIQEVLRPFGMSIPQQTFVRGSERDGTRYDEPSYPETGSKLAKLTISIDAITGDDIVDATEAGQPVTLTGKVGGGVSAGDTVTVTVNGQFYNTTVNADGRTWQVDVPGSELAKDNKVHATVNSVEPNGTPVSASTERPYVADDKTPSATVELEPGSGPNGEYNEGDTNDGKVTGTVTFDPNTTEPGDTVKITDKDGKVIIERPITQGDIDNGIQVDVPVTDGQTNVELNVDVTDPSGNTSSTGDSNLIDNVTPGLVVELEPGSGPNGEYNDGDTNDGKVEGTITFDPNISVPGDKITVTDKDGNPILDNNGDPITDYEITQGDIDNGITVEVPVDPGQTDVELNVDITDPAGNTSTGSDNKVVDNTTPGATATLEPGSGSNGEYNDDDTKDGKVTGTVTFDPDTSVGDTVKITDKDGNVIIERPVTQGDIANGITVDIPVADGQTNVEMNVEVTDPAGNTSSTDDSKTVDNLTPGVTVELEPGSGTNGKYDAGDFSSGKIEGEITFDPATTSPGDKITATDKDGNPILDSNGDPITDYEITQGDIDNGIKVELPVSPTDTGVELNVKIEDPAGNTSTGSDSNPADGVVVTAELAVSATNVDEGTPTDPQYSVTLRDTNGDPVVANNDITVNTTVGTITISAGNSAGTLDIPVQGDDVYLDGETITGQITNIVENGLGGTPIFENLTFDNTPVQTTVNDTTDTVTAKLTVSETAVDEGEVNNLIYTVTLEDAANNPVTANNDVTVTTSLGTITIKAGDSFGVLVVPVQGDDVYIDAETVTNAITNIVEANGGAPGAFEDLAFDNTPVQTVVSDTVDTTTATLSSVGSGDEDNGFITYTISLDNAPQGAQAFDLVLSNGQTETITVAAGAKTGSVTFGWGSGLVAGAVQMSGYPHPDVHLEPGYVLTVDSINASGTGGNFENLIVADNSTDLTISDSIDTTTATLTSAGSGDEDNGSVTYTVNLDHATEGDQDLTVALSNGQSATIQVAAGATSGSVTLGWGTGLTGTAIALDGYPNADVYLEPDFVLAVDSVTASGTGGNFEDLVVVDNSTDLTITDSIDTTTATLTSAGSGDEDNGSITYTVDLSNAPQADQLFSITLSNGQTANISVAAGNTSGSITFGWGTGVAAGTQPLAGYPDSDAYLEPDFDLAVTDFAALGNDGNFEDLVVVDNSTDLTITDSIDTTIATLTSVGNGDEDNGAITYTVNLDNPAQAAQDFTINLSNGQTETITVAAGATTGSVTFGWGSGLSGSAISLNGYPNSDVYIEPDFVLAVDSIAASGSGGNFEDLVVVNNSTDLTISDSIDTSTVTLSDLIVSEGTSITINASVDNAPKGTDLVLTLNNGQTITIAARTKTGSVTFTNPNDEDAYLDGETLEYSIATATGGNYEALDTSSKSTVTVEDTIDTTTVTLDSSTVNEGVDITIEASVDNAPQGSDLVLTLSNGEQITIAAGTTIGSVTFTNPNGEDVYVDGEALEYTIKAHAGGNYENLDTTAKSTVIVGDTTDTVTARLTVSETAVDEGEVNNLVYTVTLEDAANNPVTANNDVTVTTTLGTVTIKAGDSFGVLVTPVQDDDVYLDAETISNAITSVTETNAGSPGAFEDLAFDGTAVQTVVSDTIDTVTARLSVNKIAVEEGGADLEYTVTLEDANGNAVIANNSVTVVTSLGTITVAANSSSGTLNVPVPGNNVYVDNDILINEITTVTESNAGAPGAFENLGFDGTQVQTVVNDIIDTTSVSLTAGPDLDEAGGTLTYTVTLGAEVRAGDAPVEVTFKDLNGDVQTITISSGTSNTLDVVILPASLSSDVYKDPAQTIDVATDVAFTGGANFEALGTPGVGSIELTDSVDITTATLTSSGSGDEDNGTVTYTVSLDNPPQADQLFSITLNNGQTASIHVAAGANSGHITFGWGTGAGVGVQPLAGYSDSDVYLEPDFDLEVTDFVAIGNGGNFEQLAVDNQASAITIGDSLDTTTATLTSSGSGDEDNGAFTYTINLTNPAEGAQEFNVALNNGQTATITVAAGATTGSVTFGWGSGFTGSAVQLTGYPDSDVYLEPDFVLSVDGVTANGNGGNFEDLAVVNNSTDLTITDTIDSVYASITVDQSSILEGGTLTYTVELVDGNGDPVTVAPGNEVTVNLDWSGAAATSGIDVDSLPANVTITTGNSGESFDVITIDDGIVEYSESLTATISSVQDNDGTDKGFEDLKISNSNNATANILDKPTITAIDGNGAADGQITVFEKGLNDAADSSETAYGTLRVTAPTGLESISIGGTTISLTALQNNLPVTVTIAGHGELILNSFTPKATANGVDAAWDIDYSYTLTNVQTHAPGGGANEALESIALGVNVKTVDGLNTLPGTGGTLGVLVIDDVPVVIATGDALDNIQVAESSLDTPATADYSAAFSKDFGADGEATANGFVYSFEVTNPSGLADTATGSNIVLSANGATIEGIVDDGSNDVAFTIEVDADGTVTLTQHLAIKHADTNTPNDIAFLPEGSIKLVATATDDDGDQAQASVAIGDNFSFKDSGPTINGTPGATSVDEKHLPTGTAPDPDAAKVTEDLDINFGADGVGSLAFTELADQQALRAWLNASGNSDIAFTVSGNTLTATRAGNDVFTVTLQVDASGQASYSFELQGSMKHLIPNTPHELTFKYQAIDGDGDSVEAGFVVNVIDDVPSLAPKKIELDEDNSHTFNANADATQDNTIINADGQPKFGAAIVNPDGTITYTPSPNFSGKDSFTYTTTIDNQAKVFTVDVTVNPVSDRPTLDGTNVPHDAVIDLVAVSTKEDETVSLGLKAPKITDGVDQSPAAAGDAPERLGLITLELTGAHVNGAKLTADADGGSSAVDHEYTGTVTIWLTDVDHPAGMTPPAGALEMTSGQFEALVLLPAAHRGDNIDVIVKATSHEVDDSGNIAEVNGTPVPGATSEARIKVWVEAVTDDVSLVFDTTKAAADITSVDEVAYVGNNEATVTLKEDTAFTINDMLTAAFEDLDGSEERSINITNNTGQIILVDGTELAVGAERTIDAKADAAGQTGAVDSFPDISIGAVGDFSGELTGITITVNAQDKDSDGFNTGNAGTNVDGVPESDTTNNSVTLNLKVTPVAGDVVAANVETTEDTAIDFLKHVKVTDTGTDHGTEVINSVAFEIPENWVVTEPTNSGGWSVSGDGSSGNPYTITFDNTLIEEDRETVLEGFMIKPPAHSSLDATIELTVKTTDTNPTTGTDTKTFTSADVPSLAVEVKVTPVAERTDTDSDGANGNDVTMTGGHDYTTPGYEDEWFVLNIEGFNLGANWTNEDSISELTFALLTPELIAGDGGQIDANGSSFQYSTDGGTTWVTEVFSGDAIEVPVQYLNTLQFKAAPDFSGQFNINVQALTRDYDEDDLNRVLNKLDATVSELSPAQLAGLTPNEAISGGALLQNLVILPVADTATTTVTASVQGDEDEPMPLSIRPSSSDSSETFNVTIAGIPDGATLVYDGKVLTVDATGLPGEFVIVDKGDGTWSVAIDGFDPALGSAMTIKPPKDSNEEFTLKVSTVTVDKLDIPGIDHTSTSDPVTLDIQVTPKGVADEADVNIVAPGDQTFTEEAVDAAGGINLNELVTAELTDTDDSEVLSFRVSGLPEGFSLEGGTLIGDGVWSLTKDQLDGTNGETAAKLTIPENFNGTESFDFYSITTENDGDSLTEDHVISVRVSPSPEAEINLSASINEDESSALSFAIKHKSGDTDEVLDAVWIKVSDVDGATDYTLTYGDGGPLLSAAAGNSPGIVLDNGWYKLTGAALTSIHAKGSENWSGGPANFDVKYFITDPAADATVSAIQAETDATYGITVLPVTDTPTLSVTGDPDITVANAGTSVTVELNVGNVGGDYDGSETLNRIIIDGVPKGVTVDNAEYLGNDQWLMSPETVFNALLKPTITLNVESSAGVLDKAPIQITVLTQDSVAGIGTGDELSASTDISLSTNFTGGEGAPPAEILEWTQTTFEPTEEVEFQLSEAITAQIEDGVANNGFTVTLTDVPVGSTVTGMTLTMIGGKPVWSASGVGGTDALNALLEGVKVTPPVDLNKNNVGEGGFKFDAKLTTYVPNGNRTHADLEMKQTVTPVTDDADIVITAPTVAEGADVNIRIDLSNDADDPNWTLIDGKLYLTLDEAQMDLPGGTLELGGVTQSMASVTGVTGVPDGNYFVLEPAVGTPIDLVYKAATPHVSGSLNITALVKGQEAGSSLVKVTTSSVTAEVTPVNNGYDFTLDPSVSGTENATGQANADKSNVIKVGCGCNGLVDSDGSETVGTVILKNLPNDFLVYVGDTAADATLANLSSNAGADANGNNTWLLSTSGFPEYVGILPPAHWSGTLEGIQMSVSTKEQGLKESLITEKSFNLTVEAVADGVKLEPTASFGKEGQIIDFNLNAEMRDLNKVNVTDDSTESITLQFKGLGEHAAFYVDGALISDGTNVSYADGVYTVSGLSQKDVGNLGFIQAANVIGDVQVRAQTVESSNNDTSAWSHPDAETWAEIQTTITPQFGTGGDDNLLWTGENINGRGGEDTIQLRFGEDVSASDLASNLRNIETLDLGIAGNNAIGDGTVGLSAKEVLDITDGRDVLTIDGDNNDSVFLSSEWTTDKAVNSGYVAYTNTANGAVVNIAEDLYNNGNNVTVL